jgi:hypothetical protein
MEGQMKVLDEACGVMYQQSHTVDKVAEMVATMCNSISELVKKGESKMSPKISTPFVMGDNTKQFLKTPQFPSLEFTQDFQQIKAITSPVISVPSSGSTGSQQITQIANVSVLPVDVVLHNLI